MPQLKYRFNRSLKMFKKIYKQRGPWILALFLLALILIAVLIWTVSLQSKECLPQSSPVSQFPGHLDKDTYAINSWLCSIRDKVSEAGVPAKQYHPSVVSLAKLIRHDAVVRMYVTQMINQVPKANKTVHSVHELLASLNHIVTTAPSYNPDPAKRNTFPVSTLFVYMMYTPAGAVAFTNQNFNKALRRILKAWGAYLNSAASRYVLNTGNFGWLSSGAYKLNKLEDFIIPDKNAPYWGFSSFNDYFHRKIKPQKRPVSAPHDTKVIVSANDGTVARIARGIKKFDSFWAKGEKYSLADILDNDAYVDRFVGGDIFQSFLSGSDLHRWNSPISGRVVKARLIEGLMFSELRSQGFDKSRGTHSQFFESAVNTRALLFIESNDPVLGMVCVIPIGITEVSSITITAIPGQWVEKGSELGYFSYGGSSMCLVFQPGSVKLFTTGTPKPGANPDLGPKIKVNAQIAIAN